MIKILFAGHGDYPIYEQALYDAALKLRDIDAFLFTERPYFQKINCSLIRRFENKMAIGYAVSELNHDLVLECINKKIDIILIYSSRHIRPETICTIKRMGVFIAQYCNDNPFSDFYPSYFWRHWKNSIKFCDVVYVYRNSNIKECKRFGSKVVKILRSYYIEESNYYIPDKQIDIDVPEVLFLGHREHDEREIYIRELANTGVRVGLPNIPEWKDYEIGNENIIRIDNARTNYNLLLNKTKIALVFLSKINKDTYTRRCFEIPATKTMMFSIYTDDLASMFEDKKDIVMFRNKEEFINGVHYYLTHDKIREKIAVSGYERLIRDGHSAKDRVKEIIKDYYRYI